MTSQLSNEAGASELRPLVLSNYFLPLRYDLKLNINQLKPNFSGELTIDLHQNSQYIGDTPTNFKIEFHSQKLIVVKAVLLDDEPVDLNIKYDRINHRVTMWNDKIFPKNPKVVISYMGQINSIKTYKDQTSGIFKTNYLDSVSGKSDNYILATHTQPHAAKLILPLIDEPQVKVPIRLRIETLTKFRVISNCPLLKSETVSLSENSIFEFKPTPPISPSVFGFVVGDLEYLENNEIDIPIKIYTPIGESSKARYALQLISKFIPIMEDLFKYKYPLEKFDLVSLPFLSDGAMENWGLVTILSNQLLIEDYMVGSEAKRQLQELISHELIHQWIGNLVTFDDWNSLWLNEAFATLLGNYVVKVSGIGIKNFELSQVNHYENFMDKDCFYFEGESSIPSIYSYMQKVKTGLDSSTSTIFDVNAYEKGMILLRMIGNILQNDSGEVYNGDNYSVLFEGLSKLLKTFEYKTIKPVDIWSTLNDLVSVDIVSFMHSWLRYPGFPIVTVSKVQDKLRFEQHRYLFNNTPEQLNLEDQPFHIPLAIKVSDNEGKIKILNIMMTDRSIELDIPLSQFIIANNNMSGYYKTIYEQEIVQVICENISKNNLPRVNSLSIISDYGKFIGTDASIPKHFVSILMILKSFTSKSWILDYEVLQSVLTYLESINHILINYSEYNSFKSWLDNFTLKLFNKIGGWNKLTELNPKYSAAEMNVRNTILQLRMEDENCQQIAKKLFKNLINPGTAKTFTPRELLPSIFNLNIYKSSQKEYKKIFEFVKNADKSFLKHTNTTSHQVQTIAVSSLSFVLNEELLNKTLNFVMTNIDSKLIELALLGFLYKRTKEDKLKLFNWFKLHYDQWVLKSLRKGSDWAKQIGVTVSNITKIILGDIMQYDKSLIELKRKFIEEKLQTLPEHGLRKLNEEIESESEYKIAVSNLYNEVRESLNFEHL